MLDLMDRLQSCYFKYFQKLKETMVKEFEENFMKMTQQVGIWIKIIEFFKSTRWKSRFERYNKFEISEGISEFEDGLMDCYPTWRIKRKKIKEKWTNFQRPVEHH